MVITLYFFDIKSLLVIEGIYLKGVDIMNEINFVLDKINNKKVKEIVSIYFQLYLINELYKDNLITKNEYHKLYTSIKKSIKLIDC